MCSVQCARCKVQGAMCSVQCARCSVLCALCALCSVQCPVCMQCAAFSAVFVCCVGCWGDSCRIGTASNALGQTTTIFLFCFNEILMSIEKIRALEIIY